jgi:hypothetical protein
MTGTQKRFTHIIPTDTGWKTNDGSIIATKTDDGILITDNRDRYEKSMAPLQDRFDDLAEFAKQLDRINTDITSDAPVVITLPFISAAFVGSQSPYPFKKLRPGDSFRVPYPRCTKHALYCAVLRYQKNNPGKLLAIDERPKIDDEKYHYYVVTRVE